MGDYAAAAEYYDLLYASIKDYPAEAELLAGVIHDLMPTATRLLDVACGSGEHARALRALGFEVDGVDLESAFANAGMTVQRLPEVLRTRGLYVARHAPGRSYASIQRTP